MAINLHCKNCKSSLKLNTKKCVKCETPVPQKGKKYRVVVRINGKRKIKLVDNLELAKDLEKKMKIDDVRGEYDIHKKKDSITLNELWNKYLPWIKENKKSWKTDKYNYNYHLKPTFGDKTLTSISPFMIEGFIVKIKKSRSQRNKPYSLTTIKHQLFLLSRLFSIAKKWGLYSGKNPCQKVEKPKLNNQKTEYLTEDELNRLHDVLNYWPNKMTAGFISFLLHTGLRRGELFKLTWNDVNFHNKTITLKSTKGKIDQILPLSDNAIQILRELPKEFNTPWIFYGKNGKQRTDFRKPWLRVRKAAKLPDDFRLHGLRHHFASSLVSAGVDLYTVQKLLCHKDSSMTQRYAHLSDKTLRDAVNLSDKLQARVKNTHIVKLEKSRGNI